MFLILNAINILLILSSFVFGVYAIIIIKEFTLAVSAFAVLSASISGLVATTILKQNKDKERPFIHLKPNFGKYGFIQIEIANYGKETAIIDNCESNVKFPLHRGEDFFEVVMGLVIPPGNSVKYPLLITREYNEKNSLYTTKGHIKYRNIANKKYKNEFIFSIENHGSSFTDDETIKTHYQLQQIPVEIKNVEKILNQIKTNLKQ